MSEHTEAIRDIAQFTRMVAKEPGEMSEHTEAIRDCIQDVRIECRHDTREAINALSALVNALKAARGKLPAEQLAAIDRAAYAYHDAWQRGDKEKQRANGEALEEAQAVLRELGGLLRGYRNP